MRIFARQQKKENGSGSNQAVETGGRLRTELPDIDSATCQIIESVQPFTMTSPARITALVDAVRYVNEQQIRGAIVECGVWQGGSMMAAALQSIQNGTTSRELWLYDTFQGMTPPSQHDIDFLGKTADDLLGQQDRFAEDSIWCYAQLEQVKRNLASTGFPANKLRFVVGPVEKTIPEHAPEKISILRLDTDWYESTRHELEHLMPRLVSGGILIIDDYGHWQGCRRAVDEYLRSHKLPMFLNRIDYTGRLAIKP